MNQRISFIDYWRGISIYGMIFYHLIFDIEILQIADLNLIGTIYFEYFADIFRCSFLFLVGVSAYIFAMKPISRLQAYKSQFKRFSMILACALIVSAATYIFDPESFVFFGVLHLVSVASLFFIVVGRNIYLIYSFLFLLILLGSMTFASDNIIMQILGLSELQKNSVDFFPVVPWFVVILLGYLSSKYLLGFYKKLSLNVKNTCTAKVGRKSLLIYMVHQPILIAILLLLKHGVLSK